MVQAEWSAGFVCLNSGLTEMDGLILQSSPLYSFSRPVTSDLCACFLEAGTLVAKDPARGRASALPSSLVLSPARARRSRTLWNGNSIDQWRNVQSMRPMDPLAMVRSYGIPPASNPDRVPNLCGRSAPVGCTLLQIIIIISSLISTRAFGQPSPPATPAGRQPPVGSSAAH